MTEDIFLLEAVSKMSTSNYTPGHYALYKETLLSLLQGAE